MDQPPAIKETGLRRAILPLPETEKICFLSPPPLHPVEGPRTTAPTSLILPGSASPLLSLPVAEATQEGSEVTGGPASYFSYFRAPATAAAPAVAPNPPPSPTSEDLLGEGNLVCWEGIQSLLPLPVVGGGRCVPRSSPRRKSGGTVAFRERVASLGP